MDEWMGSEGGTVMVVLVIEEVMITRVQGQQIEAQWQRQMRDDCRSRLEMGALGPMRAFGGLVHC